MNKHPNVRSSKPTRILPKQADKTIEELAADIRAWAAKADEVARKAAELQTMLLRVRGTRDMPPLARPIGDGATPAQLEAEVERLLAQAPRTHQDLVTITGARSNRIAGIVWRLAETGVVRNTGLPHRAIWTMMKTKGK